MKTIIIIAGLCFAMTCHSEPVYQAQRKFVLAQRAYNAECNAWKTYYRTGQFPCVTSRAQLIQHAEKFKKVEEDYKIAWKELYDLTMPAAKSRTPLAEKSPPPTQSR